MLRGHGRTMPGSLTAVHPVPKMKCKHCVSETVCREHSKSLELQSEQCLVSDQPSESVC